VRAEFAGPVPDLSHVAGVRNVAVDGPVVECDVSGSMEPLLGALAAARAQRVWTREPSLEELFVAHYGDAPT
jgi:ABC-2 type transport system ATP-binding protein